jgi:uncharacterized membrane protein YphA (DoxX/SURF4 family)
MNVALWIAQGVLAAVFLMTGMMKLVKGKDGLKDDPKMQWVNDVPANQVRLAGMTATLGAIGLILPWALDITRVLTPLAAAGLVVQMALAVQLHIKRKETQTVMMNVMFGVFAVFVAIGRFSDLG